MYLLSLSPTWHSTPASSARGISKCPPGKIVLLTSEHTFAKQTSFVSLIRLSPLCTLSVSHWQNFAPTVLLQQQPGFARGELFTLFWVAIDWYDEPHCLNYDWSYTVVTQGNPESYWNGFRAPPTLIRDRLIARFRTHNFIFTLNIYGSADKEETNGFSNIKKIV